MPEFNLFALNEVTVADEAVKRIFHLHGRGASLNWELLKKARQYALERFPDDAQTILEDFDTQIYWTKKKLAKRGLLHEFDYDAPSYDASVDDDVDHMDDDDDV